MRLQPITGMHRHPWLSSPGENVGVKGAGREEKTEDKHGASFPPVPTEIH